jgi:hypothetical protein
MSAPAVRIPYRDHNGDEKAVRFRTHLTGGNRFRWKSGAKPFLYGLDRLADGAGTVVLVEGESDCHTLWFHDVAAVGIPGASNWREDRDAAHLDGFDVIYVVVEPDQGGATVRDWLSRSRIRDRVQIVTLGEFNDVSAVHIDDPDKFKQRWYSAIESSIPWADEESEERERLRTTAWETCSDLATEPDILSLFESVIESAGVVGETRATKLLYLAVTSRVLNRPISIAVKGPSSSGKSYTTESVLKFFPPDAYYALTAMSERALAYSNEPLKHRMLVLFEAAGMAGEMASYLIRSLLSEGQVRYETVEKTGSGMQPRLIEREGPTGLIVTTTRDGLHPENETRLLSITVTDTPEQTRAVMIAHANDANPEVDLTRWHALQEWIALSACEVVIPYASRLATLVPPVAVRLRRDFPALLSLVRAHALLHQVTRKRDAEGRVIATVEDYRAVRELIADLVAEGVEASVSATMRETVSAVADLSAGDKPTTNKAVAERLGIDPSAASRRVDAATRRGYVVNQETGKGRRAKLVLGDPMPAELEVLPDPDELIGAVHDGDESDCTIDRGLGDYDPPPPHGFSPSDTDVGTDYTDEVIW